MDFGLTEEQDGGYRVVVHLVGFFFIFPGREGHLGRWSSLEAKEQS